MNRLQQLFSGDKKNFLSIYFTAGYPNLNSTLQIAKKLEDASVDFLEIGFPYSDPLADGPVIQESSLTALHNGMTLKVLFEQLKELRNSIKIPVLLMGYANPMIQFGVKEFCTKAAEVGVDGVIVPDLPMYEYEELYKNDFLDNNLSNIFLVTPQTSTERIRKIDELSNSFIYLLSSSSTTGKNLAVSDATDQYFSRIKAMNLKNPSMIGFGISNAASFQKATQNARGAIIGSAFVKHLGKENGIETIGEFIKSIK